MPISRRTVLEIGVSDISMVVDPIHMGIVSTIILSVGLVTSPYGTFFDHLCLGLSAVVPRHLSGCTKTSLS